MGRASEKPIVMDTRRRPAATQPAGRSRPDVLGWKFTERGVAKIKCCIDYLVKAIGNRLRALQPFPGKCRFFYGLCLVREVVEGRPVALV